MVSCAGADFEDLACALGLGEFDEAFGDRVALASVCVVAMGDGVVGVGDDLFFGLGIIGHGDWY